VNLFSLFHRIQAVDADVRAEIWRLGGRHMGQPLEGALAELKAPDLPPARAVLLRACVRKLQRQ
jgi:hypothetical protein